MSPINRFDKSEESYERNIPDDEDEVVGGDGSDTSPQVPESVFTTREFINPLSTEHQYQVNPDTIEGFNITNLWEGISTVTLQLSAFKTIF